MLESPHVSKPGSGTVAARGKHGISESGSRTCDAASLDRAPFRIYLLPGDVIRLIDSTSDE